MKVVKANIEILQRMPNLFNLIYRFFQDKEVEVYACMERSDNLSFLILNGVNGVYVNSSGYRPFVMDLDLNVLKYVSDNYDAFFKEGLNPKYIDGDKHEYALEILSLDEPDEEGYTGEVLFNQYNPQTDTFLQIGYPHMFYEVDGFAKIYSYHTNIPGRFYMESDSKNNHERKFGPISKHISSYNSIVYERDMLGYTMMVMNEHGVINTLLNGTYAYEYEDKLRRFTKAAYMLNGEYKDFWPLCKLYRQEEINQMIKEAGFLISVPEEIIDIYDNTDRYLADIRDILRQIKEKELRDACGMKLTLVPDEDK